MDFHNIKQTLFHILIETFVIITHKSVPQYGILCVGSLGIGNGEGVGVQVYYVFV